MNSQGQPPKTEREMYLEKMKEQLNIVNTRAYAETKVELEAHIDHLKSKLEKFEAGLLEIHKTYKQCFNEQTRELIVSHGEKFISV